MGYDPSSDEYVAIYPYDVSQAPPFARQRLEILSASLAEDEIWLVSAGPKEVAAGAGTGAAQFEAIVGYSLSDSYAAGKVAQSWELPASSGGRSGNGGGEASIEPGTGTLRLTVPMSAPLEPIEGTLWPAGLRMRVALIGDNADGSDAVEGSPEINLRATSISG